MLSQEPHRGRNDHPLAIDRATGKKDIIVSLRSDQDALPHEHEQRHRELVDKLIEGGL